VSLLVLLLAASQAAGSATSRPGGPANGSDFAFAKLGGDVHVGFALVRSGGGTGGGSIGEVVVPGSNDVSRVLFDQKGGAYFGYRLEAQALPLPGRFKVAFRSLEARIAGELERRIDCPDCLPPTPLAAGDASYPPPRLVADGEATAIDLLFNPQTREKIFDLLIVSRRPIPVSAMREAAERIKKALIEVRRGDNFVARRSLEEAAAAYARALALNPNDATVCNQLGMCYQRMGRDREAWQQYERALELNPDYYAVWNNMGSIEHSRGRYKQAVKRYERAVALKGDYAKAYKNMGAAYFAMERYDDGLEAYRTAFRLDPSVFRSSANAPVMTTGVDIGLQYFFFAKICAQAGRLDAALDLLTKAYENGFRDFDRVAADHDFGALLEHPRYLALVAGEPLPPTPAPGTAGPPPSH
jgi:tetratricopeptide (TPR) repeat protein